MTTPLTLTPNEADILYWCQSFVPELALWWWDDSSIPLPQNAVRVIDRTRYRDDVVGGDIVYVNAFHAWVMPREVTRIVVEDGGWVASLGADEHQRASRLQVKYSRGMCIARGRLPNDIAPPAPAVVDDHVVLYPALWESLSLAARRCVIKTELPMWDRDTTSAVPAGTPGHIARIANTFVRQEGVNCLAVTAYAISGDYDLLMQWLMPEQFLSVLAQRGFREVENASIHADDVVVMKDADRIVHAAYALQPDLLLNKNGQTSFNPIALIDIAMLRRDWRGYSLSVFRRYRV